MQLQLPQLFASFHDLHIRHWEKNLAPVFWAWCISRPKIFFIFMNPTWKNISAEIDWQWIRAPWLWTKNIRKLLFAVWCISKKTFTTIQSLALQDWTPLFCETLYEELANNGIYITNLAKCTQKDARPLHNNIFKDYLDLIYEEIDLIKPQHIITLGNQVSSLVLQKPITVSSYEKKQYESLLIKKLEYKIYPVFYPVGQGMRNMPKAIKRISSLITSVK